MRDETVTRPQGWLPGDRGRAVLRPPLVLVLVWSHAEPTRVGEIALLPNAGSAILGRGSSSGGPGEVRLAFGAARPGLGQASPLSSPGLSRRQLALRIEPRGLVVERVGRAPLRLGQGLVDQGRVAPGDIIEVQREALFLCIERREAGAGGARPGFAFGTPDEHGIVGESARTWALRDELAGAARRPQHVLVTGPSGAGKELAASAIHALSARARGPFVARNAATIPPGILDAELFGNARNFPNAGMTERAGLLGEASGGTLFLDEIGELPEALQAHLLRVLDAGEYHRLGEDRPRRADVRVLGATNRSVGALKPDFAARFKLSVAVPGLEERREDIPLLARAILRGSREHDDSVAARFFDADEPRIAPELVRALLAHSWTGHIRELESMLLRSIAESQDHFLALTHGVAAQLRARDAGAEARERGSPGRAADEGAAPTREAIERALASNHGNVSKAWKDLGLPSRDALNRLMKKLGVRR